MPRFTPVLFALLGGLSCAGPPSGPARPDPAPSAEPAATSQVEPTPVVVPRTSAARAEVICDRAIRCGTIGRSQRDDCLQGEGASRLTLVWGSRDLLGIDAFAAAGRLVPVAGAEEACLEFLASAPCRIDPASAPERCAGGAVPPGLTAGVAPGGTCTRGDECIDGVCTAQPGCTGVCVARSPLGGACGSDQVCTEDAFCWEGRCLARAEVGATCAGHWQWCKDGLFCDGYDPGSDHAHHRRPPTPGRCSAGKRLGEPCVPPVTAGDEVCAAPLFCDWGEDQPVCRSPLGEGEACRWLDACGEGMTCAGLVLGGRHPLGTRYGVRRPGRCARVLDAGAPCDPAAHVDGCPASMLCDRQRRVCRSRGHEGDPCVSSWAGGAAADEVPLRNDGCVSGHYCEVATRTCKRQLPNGARCTPVAFGVEDDPCFLGQCQANTGRCAPRCG